MPGVSGGQVGVPQGGGGSAAGTVGFNHAAAWGRLVPQGPLPVAPGAAPDAALTLTDALLAQAKLALVNSLRATAGSLPRGTSWEPHDSRSAYRFAFQAALRVIRTGSVPAILPAAVAEELKALEEAVTDPALLTEIGPDSYRTVLLQLANQLSPASVAVTSVHDRLFAAHRESHKLARTTAAIGAPRGQAGAGSRGRGYAGGSNSTASRGGRGGRGRGGTGTAAPPYGAAASRASGLAPALPTPQPFRPSTG